MCNLISQCDFECDDFHDKFLYPMAIKKEFADCKFPLDICMMKQHQEKDNKI